MPTEAILGRRFLSVALAQQVIAVHILLRKRILLGPRVSPVVLKETPNAVYLEKGQVLCAEMIDFGQRKAQGIMALFGVDLLHFI